jgi:uncharacterized protein YceH (UPF0502 family)
MNRIKARPERRGAKNVTVIQREKSHKEVQDDLEARVADLEQKNAELLRRIEVLEAKTNQSV